MKRKKRASWNKLSPTKRLNVSWRCLILRRLLEIFINFWNSWFKTAYQKWDNKRAWFRMRWCVMSYPKRDRAYVNRLSSFEPGFCPVSNEALALAGFRVGPLTSDLAPFLLNLRKHLLTKKGQIPAVRIKGSTFIFSKIWKIKGSSIIFSKIRKIKRSTLIFQISKIGVVPLIFKIWEKRGYPP